MEDLHVTVNGLALKVNWLYIIPCAATVIANSIFLVLIIVVLVCKLNHDSHRHSSPPAGNYDRATMIKTAKAVGKLREGVETCSVSSNAVYLQNLFVEYVRLVK